MSDDKSHAEPLYAGYLTRADVGVMQRVLDGPADPEIVACEAALRAAQLAADVDALDRLIAGDLLFTGPFVIYELHLL